MNLSLFPRSVPPGVPNIDLRNCSVEALLESGDVSDIRLVAADPPWQYRNTGTGGSGFEGSAKEQYDCPSMEEIVNTLDRAFDCCLPDAYMLCWSTWPMLLEFIQGMQRSRWRYLSGGAWIKTGGLGIGFHLRGDSEPFLLFSKGKPRPRMALSNAYSASRTKHSEKPVGFWIRVIDAMTEPEDKILSVYSGLCPEARAAKVLERYLIGAEIDGERFQTALGLLAGVRA